MDCHKILQVLMQIEENDSPVINEENLLSTLVKAYSNIPEDIKTKITLEKNSIISSNSHGWEYLHLISFTLKMLLNNELNEENPIISNNQLQNIKKAVEVISSIGILSCLTFGPKLNSVVEFSLKYKLNQNEVDIFEKHKILTHMVNILLKCFEKNFIKSVVEIQIDVWVCFIGALLQLSHAPLKKPVTQCSNSTTIEKQFIMTEDLYNKLKTEQNMYGQKLNEFMDNCFQPLLLKVFMILNACIKINPQWLHGIIHFHLTNRIMMPSGVSALVLAICGDISDLGKCWNKLEIATQLIVKSSGTDKKKYYNSICTQFLEMLNSTGNQQKTIIATSCIKALYDENPEMCTEKIIHPIMNTFLIKYNNEAGSSNLLQSEEEVSRCIENLVKLFITTDTDFKCIPIDFLISISLPIFLLHVQSYQSIYALRSKVQQLLMKILSQDHVRESVYSIFLNYEELDNSKFGEKLNYRFGNNGGLEIISGSINWEHEKIADCLFNLVENDQRLSFDLFTYLLKTIPNMNKYSQKVSEGFLLETSEDTVNRIEKQLSAMKLLTLLASSTLVQKAQLENPEPFLNFIKFYISKVTSNLDTSKELNDSELQEQDESILFTCLMFIKLILTDVNVNKSWNIFNEFIQSVNQNYNLKKLPPHIITIFEEIENLIKKKGKSFSSSLYDLSVDNKNLTEFEKAMADLADPLLPVRAHGIITLTKLIESHHPEVQVKKDIILCILQENLEDDDSFIYLAAINGLCAMSSMFPDAVIETLVQEFVGMTQGIRNKDIPPETRTKLGEILVKTTRNLGEMTPKYKNLLVSGFLSGTRDSDPLVRASSLSCLGEFCKTMGFRLGNMITEILYCIGCIIKTDKDEGCRRAGVLVATLLLQGLGKDALFSLGENLVPLYRSLIHLRNNDKDSTLQLHAQLAIDEFDDIVKKYLFDKPKLEKSIFLLPNNM